MKIKGRDLTLSLDNSVVAASRSCTLKFSADTIEKASATSGKWKEFIANRCSWSMSCDNLCTDSSLFDAVAIIGTEVEAKFTVYDDFLTGNAIVTDCTLTGSMGEMATYTIQLQGSGELWD